MPTSVRPARRLRLRQGKSAERDCCNYCQCLFHVFVSVRRMIAPLLTIDRGPHAAVTNFCNRNDLIPVTFFGVDTFLYAWMTMSTLAHWSSARAAVTTTPPARSEERRV